MNNQKSKIEQIEELLENDMDIKIIERKKSNSFYIYNSKKSINVEIFLNDKDIWKFYTLREKYYKKQNKNFEEIKAMFLKSPDVNTSVFIDTYYICLNDDYRKISKNDINYSEFAKILRKYENDKAERLYQKIKSKYEKIVIEKEIYEIDEDGIIYEYYVFGVNSDGSKKLEHTSYLLNSDWLFWANKCDEQEI